MCILQSKVVLAIVLQVHGLVWCHRIGQIKHLIQLAEDAESTVGASLAHGESYLTHSVCTGTRLLVVVSSALI